MQRKPNAGKFAAAVWVFVIVTIHMLGAGQATPRLQEQRSPAR